jgi:hypothetical protein
LRDRVRFRCKDGVGWVLGDDFQRFCVVGDGYRGILGVGGVWRGRSEVGVGGLILRLYFFVINCKVSMRRIGLAFKLHV